MAADLGEKGLPRASLGRSPGETAFPPEAPRPRRPIPPKLYRIGEVVDYAGVSRQTIHNYTTMGLLQESKCTNGGHRLYDESVFEMLDRIEEMKSRRISLQDIREHFLHRKSEVPAGAPAGPAQQDDRSRESSPGREDGGAGG